MTQISPEVETKVEETPLEVAQRDLATIVDSPNPIKTLNELVDSRGRNLRLDFEESVKLIDVMKPIEDKQAAYDARVLLTWHCLPTLSSVLGNYTDVIENPKELFELGINLLQEELSSWQPDNYLTRHLHQTITRAIERSVTEELGLTAEDFGLVKDYIRARKEFAQTYEREAGENNLWELLLIMEEKNPKVIYPESDKSKLGIIHERYSVGPLDVKDSYELNEDTALLREQLETALSTIKPREQKVLEERFIKGRAQREVGRDFGVTPARISAIEAKALRKLRQPRRSRLLRDYL